MKILIACEASQIMCKAFREKGHEAYSCDLEDSYGGHPEWHIKGDVLPILKEKWDMMIAHPPCTHLAVSGARHFEKKRADGRQQQGIDLFMAFTKTEIPKVCIENPMGIMSTLYRKPDQIIHPYYFGDEAQKTTCLWLKNLPPLYHNAKPNLFDDVVTHSNKGEFKVCASGKKFSMWEYECAKQPIAIRAKLRSKTFPGIAEAMANQWSSLIKTT